MAKKHVMTPARRAALARAQKASAAKRRGKGKGKLAAANRAIGKKGHKTSVKKRVLHGAIAAGGYLAGYYGGMAHFKHKSR